MGGGVLTGRKGKSKARSGGDNLRVFGVSHPLAFDQLSAPVVLLDHSTARNDDVARQGHGRRTPWPGGHPGAIGEE
jgi:hypothetical protein